MAIRHGLTARLPEVLRLRLGAEKVSATKPGEPLKTWRASGHEHEVHQFAGACGGIPEPWPKGPSPDLWHVTTEVEQLPVLLPPDPLNVFYEQWGKGGCQRRCDGVRAMVPVQTADGGHLEEVDCVCLASGWSPGDRKDKNSCNVTVRLRVILADLPSLGEALLTSGSIYAAQEMQAQIDMLARAAPGAYVPALLGIEPRTEKKAFEKYSRNYLVPTLTISTSIIGLAQLADWPIVDLIGAAKAEVASAPVRAELSAPPKPAETQTGAIPESEMIHVGPETIVIDNPGDWIFSGGRHKGKRVGDMGVTVLTAIAEAPVPPEGMTDADVAAARAVAATRTQ